MQSNTKLVSRQEEWDKVTNELEAEELKLAYYDKTLVEKLGDVRNKNILDYGSGPGVLALALSKLGAKVKTFDINTEFNKSAATKIGLENVYHQVTEIPDNHFNFVIANLLLCIVSEDEVRRILRNILRSLHDDGRAFIGFCNPKIYNVEESNIDFRFPTGARYEENHDYKKVKKEGGYEIIESHRPIEWYFDEFTDAGFVVEDTVYTPEYSLNGMKIEDFVIISLKKG